MFHAQVTLGVSENSSDSLCALFISKHSKKANSYFRFVSFVGIAYQLPGAIAGERALLLTEHMKAMGLLDSARIMCVM